MVTQKKSSKHSKKGHRRPLLRGRGSGLGVERGARNPQPRARLGPEAPSTPALTVDPRLIDGIALFNHRRFFECHEILERVWLETAGTPRDFYKGVIQAAVAFHHWSKGNVGGAMSLYRSSSRYLRRFRPACCGIDVESFLQRYTELFGWLRRHPRQRYDARLVPHIHWADASCAASGLKR